MKKSICTLLSSILLFSLLSCGDNLCEVCVDAEGTIETTNSTSIDWLFLTPNIFNSYEDDILFFVGGDFNNTSSVLTDIASYEITLMRDNEVLKQQTAIENITGNASSGYELRFSVEGISESTNKGSELLDLVINVSTTSDQALNYRGKIQYIDCDAIDFDNFDAADCRWSCQLRSSGFLEEWCQFCF